MELTFLDQKDNICYCIYFEEINCTHLDGFTTTYFETCVVKFDYLIFSAEDIKKLLETYGSRKNEQYCEIVQSKVLFVISEYLYKCSKHDFEFEIYDFLNPTRVCYKQEYLNYDKTNLKKLYQLWSKHNVTKRYKKFITPEFLQYIEEN